MKKSVFLMCMFFIAIPAFAQIGIIWQVVDCPYRYLGSANMDNDPNEECVYYSNSRIVILDGLSGLVEWDSGEWFEIYIAGYNSYKGDNYGFSPFCDVNNDGIKEITFWGRQNVGEPNQTFVVGISGAGIDDEPSNPNPFNPTTTIK